jgi:hypothetical protein
MPSQGHFGQHMKFSIGRSCIHRAFTSSQRKNLDHATCRLLRSFSTLHPISTRRASSLGFVAQPSNPDGFMVNRRKPRECSLHANPTHDLAATSYRLDLCFEAHISEYLFHLSKDLFLFNEYFLL